MSLLDGSKTGLILKPEVRKRDVVQWLQRPPLPWKPSKQQAGSDIPLDFSNGPSLKRKKGLPPFILVELRRGGQKIEHELKEKFKKKPRCYSLDSHLAVPFKKAKERAREQKEIDGYSRPLEELELIKKHVEYMWKKHREKVTSYRPNSPSKKVGFTELRITDRQDILRDLSREFNSEPANLRTMSEVELLRVRASYAYIYDYEKSSDKSGFTRFPWDVAFRELCSEYTNRFLAT